MLPIFRVTFCQQAVSAPGIATFCQMVHCGLLCGFVRSITISSNSYSASSAAVYTRRKKLVELHGNVHWSYYREKAAKGEKRQQIYR